MTAPGIDPAWELVLIWEDKGHAHGPDARDGPGGQSRRAGMGSRFFIARQIISDQGARIHDTCPDMLSLHEAIANPRPEDVGHPARYPHVRLDPSDGSTGLLNKGVVG